MDIFDELPPDAKDLILRRVLDGLVPKSPTPVAPGVVANDLWRFYKQAQPKLPADVTVPARYTMGPATALLREAYTSKGRPVETPPPKYTEADAIATVKARWPWLWMDSPDHPDRKWARQPEVIALQRQLYEVSQHRDLHPMSSGGFVGQRAV